MSPGVGAAQVLQALASADCDRMSRALLLMDQGRFACALVTAAEMSTVRRNLARMRDSDLFPSGGDSLVLGVGVRLIQRPIRERSLQLLFVHSVPERGALRDDRCRNSLRPPLLYGPHSYGVCISLIRVFS